MKFFRACPECKKFFYSKDRFRLHKCGEVEEPETVSGNDTATTPTAPDTDTVETADNGDNKQPAAPDTDNKAVLRAHYLEYLKGKGVDMSTERSFRKIEEAYRENGGK